MGNWFMQLPRRILVAILLVGGVLFIVVSDPPKTVCDSQIALFDETMVGVLTVDAKKKSFQKKPAYERLYELCNTNQSPGACYEYFQSLRDVLKGIGTVSSECYGKLSGHTGFSEALFKGLDLMVRIAWGKEPPATLAVRSGWLSAADLNLFCSMKKNVMQIFGEEKWSNWSNQYFGSLPGAASVVRDEAWQKMLPATNCSTYL